MLTRRDVLFSVPLSLGVASRLGAQQPTFRIGAQNVPVYVTVTDANKRLVPGLEQSDFEIYDEKVKVPIGIFDNQIQPVTVAVMLDSSGSMTMTLELLKQAAEQFVIRLLPEDKARIGYFNDKIAFLSDFSNDRDMLIASIRDMQFGNPTRLFDAILFSLDELKDIEGRKVILAFTDGADTASRGGQGEVLRRARDEEVMIYGIGLQSMMQGIRTRPDGALRKMADETGGGYFELRDTDDLGPTFTRVAQELHSQYLLGFEPRTDGKVHKIEVRLTRPGLTARGRRSYQAPRS
ncbi:MAG: VWA domain-containing protein [Acidobacteria bacterium]|nr:VWA domain-containing protein [Acidobacteriota bacterium]